MRTGPDLINVGQRLPDPDWHLIHFYDPRALNEWSIMPAFPYLFELKDSAEVRPGDRVVPVRGPRAPPGKVVVAKPEALALTAYLLSLKRQYPVRGEERATVRTPGGGAAARGVHTMP
jgi:cytochrome c oxidase cbb3-type subunit 2